MRLVEQGPSIFGKVKMRQGVANSVNTILFEEAYEMKLIDNGARLRVGGKTFDVYGERRTIVIRKDGKVQ
jgi:hypothetical protein